MAEPLLFSLDKDQSETLKGQIEQLERYIKNKSAMLETGVLTPEQFKQLEDMYKSAKTMYDSFKAKQS